MGLDIVLLLVALGLTILILGLRVDVGILALLSVSSILIGGLFVDDVLSLLGNQNWPVLVGVRIVVLLGFVLAGILFMRRTAIAGMVTNSPTALLVSLLLITTGAASFNAVGAAPAVSSYFAGQLVILKDWLALLTFVAGAVDVFGFRK